MFAREADWHAASPYPPVGRAANVDFGSAKFGLDFIDDKTMSFVAARPGEGIAVEVRAAVFGGDHTLVKVEVHGCPLALRLAGVVTATDALRVKIVGSALAFAR